MWGVAQRAFDQGAITQDKCDDIVGVFMVRCALKAVDKEKLAPDGRVFTSMQDIKNEVCKSMKLAAGDTELDLESLLPDGGLPVEEPTKKRSNDNVLVSFDQQNDPVYIFGENGFSIGDFVKEKRGTSTFVYKIISASEKVRVQKFDLFCKDPFVVDIDIKTFVTNWVKDKSKRTQILEEPEDMNAQVEIDNARSKAYSVLYNAQMVEPLYFVIHSMGTMAHHDIQVNAIKLVPFTLMNNITGDKRPGSIEVKVDEHVLHLTPTPKPDADKDLEKYVFAPFWWVRKTADQSLANMKYVTKKVDNVSYPCLQNFKSIKQHEYLYVHHVKEVREPLVGAVVVENQSTKRRRSSAGSKK